MENLKHLLFNTGLEQDDVIVFAEGLEKTAYCLGNNLFLVGQLSSIVSASRKSLRASSPTRESSRMEGYRPRSSQVWKKGVQSMKGLRLSSETGRNSSNGTLSPRSGFFQAFPVNTDAFE